MVRESVHERLLRRLGKWAGRHGGRKEEEENVPFPCVCTASNRYCPRSIQALCQGKTEPARLPWGTHPPVFCQKRLQTIENKELEPRKERQEIPRGGKLMKGQGLSRRPTWMRGTIG